MTVLPELSFQEISRYFHLPISQAAKELKVCETLLKKICRVNGIKRWPHRKIRSIDTMINLLEFRLQTEKLSEKERTRMKNEIQDLLQKKSFFMESPNTTYQSIIPKNTLQSFSKTKLKNQKNFSIFLHSEGKKSNASPSDSEELTTTSSSIIISNMKFKESRRKGETTDNTSAPVNIKKEKDVNMEDEEEEVLNLLYSLKNQSPTLSNQEIINNNDYINNDFPITLPPINTAFINNNNENIPNELYKLSLLAILNPISDEITENNNENVNNNNNNVNNNFDGEHENFENIVNEKKMRNILRRSMEGFDHDSSGVIKRRKVSSIEAIPSNAFEFCKSPLPLC